MAAKTDPRGTCRGHFVLGLGHEPAPVQQARGRRGGRLHGHRDLAVANLAQRARVLPGHVRRGGAVPPEPGVVDDSRGPTASTARAAKRRRTGSTFHGDEEANCCSCWWSTPSRSAIGCIDLGRPSSNSPCRYRRPSRAGPCGQRANTSWTPSGSPTLSPHRIHGHGYNARRGCPNAGSIQSSLSEAPS